MYDEYLGTYSCKGARPNLAVVFNAPTRALGEKTTISPQKTTHNCGLFAVTWIRTICVQGFMQTIHAT